MDYLSKVEQIIEENRHQFINISNKIWDLAEMSYQEKESAELLCECLEVNGFNVEKNVANIDTAFKGSYGNGRPVVAFLGEYDALASLSQEKGVVEHQPIKKNGSGHGCGHNLLGTGAFAAAVAVKEYMETNHLSGTVRYYGCPAEESGDGKTYMVREGLFADVDFSLTWHPMAVNGVSLMNALATYQVYFRFKGQASHAAVSPHLGRSALDAVEMMNVGVNYLREHIIPEARVHYATTDTGGFSPNVVQASAEVLYLIRAPEISEVEKIYQRICKIAKGAALITETEVEIEFDSGTSNFIKNTTMDHVMMKNFQKLGIPKFTEQEMEFAKKIRQTLSQEERENLIDDTLKDMELTDVLLPLSVEEKTYGSTDVADVSWVVPTAQAHTTCMASGTSLHTWQAVSQVGTSIGHKGMLHAGKVLAATAIDMLQNEQLVEQAKQDLKQKLGERQYISPIPEGVVAPINRK